MSRQIKLTVQPFEYKLTLQDNALHIEANHIEDCLVWQAIIDDSLEGSSPAKKEAKPQKQFVINLDPEEIFDLFDYYEKEELPSNTKITFPKIYKTENDHLCIFIDFQMSFGKQRCDTKCIKLKSVPIPKDTIMFQKLENLKTKTIAETEVVLNRVESLEVEFAELAEKFAALKSAFDTLQNSSNSAKWATS
jgi:hypothetical protein